MSACLAETGIRSSASESPAAFGAAVAVASSRHSTSKVDRIFLKAADCCTGRLRTPAICLGIVSRQASLRRK